MKMNKEIKRLIEDKTKEKVKSLESVSGGCISNAYKVILESGKNLFLKMNPGSSKNMFVKEANGLNELRKANAIRVPEVIAAENSFILTEFIERGRQSNKFFEDFGERFANLHKFTSENFGFYEDNYIGSNEQMNIPSEDEKNNWTKFYFNKRLLFQFKLAQRNGYADEKLRKCFSSLEDRIEDILKESEEKPSVLHGDLWSGNFMSDENGNPCIIDPAVYYGHREADLAMTKLFGGFNSEFYNSYDQAYPLKAGYEYRENIYKLYHVLNHLNLFGRGYYSQALSLIQFYL
jgi:protein-ribulosamine 3-kinase